MTTTTATTEAEWLDWRRQGVTATDVANAYTGSYGGSHAIVARKLGMLAPEETNERMERGNRWETRVADLVHVATGLYVHGEQTWCQNADHPHHRATIDGLLSPLAAASMDDIDAVLETKTNGVGARPAWDRWNAQVQWQLWCTGMPRGLIARAVIDDTDDTFRSLDVSWVERDDFLISVLIDLAEMMWTHIQTGTLPDPDTPTALDTVKEVHALADLDALPVDLSDHADELRRFIAIKGAVKAVEDERDLIEARIRARLGHATKGTADGLTVSLSKPRAAFTPEAEQAFLDIHPDAKTKTVLDRTAAKALDKALYDELSQPIGARTLTIKETKK